MMCRVVDEHGVDVRGGIADGGLVCMGGWCTMWVEWGVFYSNVDTFC